MAKIIAVTGATGAQGGGVVNVMIEEKGWKVRGITRNPDSDAAKKLKERGAEVVSANFDDESSLAEAFEGAHAIFAVTNFWEHLFTGKNQAQSGEAEEEQAMKLARAAAKTSTLEHYIWSTLPSAKNLTNGKLPVPHVDYKADVDDRIRKELPELAKKTTYLYFGYYPSNIAFFPQAKPFEVPGSYGKHIQMLPTPATATIPVAGDMTVTPGLWVRAILNNPDKTRGKYADVATEIMTFAEQLKIWSEVSGKQAVYIQCSPEEYEQLWGIAGKELAMQFKWGEVVTDWHAHLGDTFVTKEELGLQDAPGFRKAIEGLKQFL